MPEESDRLCQGGSADRLDPHVWVGTDQLMSSALRIGGRTMEPAVLVQSLFGGMWPNTPHEVFTEDIPPAVSMEDITIDVMGSYDPDVRAIKIYTRLIATFCDRHGLSRQHVEIIVRVHEYAHALVHLGILDNTSLEDEGLFLSLRRKLFGTVGHLTHELLAQSITWLVLERRQDVRNVFEAILPNQPVAYDLSPKLRSNLSTTVVRAFVSLLHSQYFSEAEMDDANGIRAALEQSSVCP